MTKRASNIAAHVEYVGTNNGRRLQSLITNVEVVNILNNRRAQSLVVMVEYATAPKWPVEKYGPKVQMMG